MEYEAKKFNIPALEGISGESIKQHIALYEGYVKNFNAIYAAMAAYATEGPEKHTLALAELVRRHSFEFGGMRLHEHYFPQLEGGATAPSPESALSKQIEKDFNQFDHLLAYFKMVAGLRGPGWAILYWDPEAKQLLAGWTEEQHVGNFATLPIVLALDVWEHAYVLDYGASGRGKYLDAFFKNLNWGVLEKRFEQLAS